MKAEFNRSYCLCPKTFDDFIQQQKEEVITFHNCFSSRTFWAARIVCKGCRERSACYVNEAFDQNTFRWTCMEDQVNFKKNFD